MTSLTTNGPFDLAETLHSGQVFHWDRLRLEGHDGFAGCIGNSPPVFLAQPEPETILTTADETVIRNYFHLDLSPDEIRTSFPKEDACLEKAIAYSPGLRIIRQPTWECLATFITSSLKQVAHIREISLTLRRRFGVRHHFAGREFFSYPSPEALAGAGEAELRNCALGYRAKSLWLTARAIAEGEADLGEVHRLESNREALEFLCQFHGVGEKIANCVLLFGCGRLDAFPIDVWIERILRREYRKRIKGAKLQAWAESRFGPYAGCAQQHLFHYARTGPEN